MTFEERELMDVEQLEACERVLACLSNVLGSNGMQSKDAAAGAIACRLAQTYVFALAANLRKGMSLADALELTVKGELSIDFPSH